MRDVVAQRPAHHDARKWRVGQIHSARIDATNLGNSDLAAPRTDPLSCGIVDHMVRSLVSNLAVATQKHQPRIAGVRGAHRAPREVDDGGGGGGAGVKCHRLTLRVQLLPDRGMCLVEQLPQHHLRGLVALGRPRKDIEDMPRDEGGDPAVEAVPIEDGGQHHALAEGRDEVGVLTLPSRIRLGASQAPRASPTPELQPFRRPLRCSNHHRHLSRCGPRLHDWCGRRGRG
mmetsp:Transcript_46814/g.150466  ORF Transcript_46814/g.150466 Transcript_46814/m.150466 type:complete len:230 (-) Transcript_46814:224-913(-)